MSSRLTVQSSWLGKNRTNVPYPQVVYKFKLTLSQGALETLPNRTESLTIGQVAERVGLRTSALRYYETVGILPVPERVSGQRVYDASIFKHVRLIQAAQVAGFSIEDIKMLLVDSKGSKPFAERLQELARRKLEEVEKLIASVQTMKQLLEAVITCQCSGMEDCLLFVKDDE